MNNAWFFGDSFTNGHGCKPRYRFYDEFPELRSKRWTELISDKLELNEVNLGIDGNSNTNILNNVLLNLPNFKKGDYVFLSDTSPIRLPLPNIKGDALIPFTPELLVWPRTQDEDFAIEFFKNFFTSDEEQKVLVDYIYTFYFDHYELWSKFYFDQLNAIATQLLSIGVHTFTWSWKIWHISNKFSTIEKATKGKIKDKHWDWEGHKGFASYLLKRIENKEFLYKKELI